MLTTYQMGLAITTEAQITSKGKKPTNKQTATTKNLNVPTHNKGNGI